VWDKAGYGGVLVYNGSIMNDGVIGMKRTAAAVLCLCLAVLGAGCGQKTESDVEEAFDGVRVLMRYDFGSQEYASVDAAQRELERWVAAYNTEAPADGYSGAVTFDEVMEAEAGYRGYLDCGDIRNFTGVQILESSTDAAGLLVDGEAPLEVTELATGETADMDAGLLAALPAECRIVYGPVDSLMMGADQIVVEPGGPVLYATGGWTAEETRITADPVVLFQRGEAYFAFVIEPGSKVQAADTKSYSWVVILAVGVIGIAGILILSRWERPGRRRG
jgi:hypothetical protein